MRRLIASHLRRQALTHARAHTYTRRSLHSTVIRAAAHENHDDAQIFPTEDCAQIFTIQQTIPVLLTSQRVVGSRVFRVLSKRIVPEAVAHEIVVLRQVAMDEDVSNNEIRQGKPRPIRTSRCCARPLFQQKKIFAQRH